MNFLRRLKLFGIGFAIGLAIVFSMFGTRSCVTPNEQKMQELVFQHFQLSEKTKCKLECMRMNEQLLKIELRHFEVNYDLSTVRKEPCGEYYIQPKEEFINLHPYKLLIYDCDTISRIDDISVSSSTLNCKCQ